MAMQYDTGFDFKYNDKTGFDFSDNLQIPSDCSFSVGETLQTTSKFSKDYSGTSQSLTRCQRAQAKTYSINYNLSTPEYLDLFKELGYIESCVGRIGHLYFNGIDFGLTIINSAALSLAIDCASIITSIAVTLNVTEAREPVKKPPVKQIKNIRE